MYRLFLRVSTMVWYNRGKAFAKMSPVLCGNGKVCKEYAKTAGVRDGKRGGGVRAPRPTHGFLSGVVGRPALWPPWPFAAAEVPRRDESLPYGLNRRRDLAVSCGPGMPGPYRVVMGKRDVAAGWRAAYMRPLQMPGRLAATIVGGGVRTPRPYGFTQILHNIYFPVVV